MMNRKYSYNIPADMAWDKMKKWVDRNACVIDTETTGLGHDAKIVDLAIADMQGNKLFESLINPGEHIPEGATQVHGITDDMVKDAPAFEDVAMKIMEILYEHQPVLAYNAAYDMPIMDEHFRKAGPVLESLADGIETDCAMKTYASFRMRKPMKLSICAEECGISSAGAHRAMADVLMTVKLINKAVEEPKPELYKKPKKFEDVFPSLSKNG